MNEKFEKIVASCLSCKNPKCEKGCPNHMPISTILSLLKMNKTNDAKEMLYAHSPFPFVMASLCDKGRQCFSSCVKKDQVPFFEIEKELGNAFVDDVFFDIKHKSNQKVAIIGAGISGLSAAYYLIKAGFEVSIFEKENYLGGVIKTSLPKMRFCCFSSLDKMIEKIEKASFVFYNQEFGKNLKLSDLEKFDYIIIAYGAQIERDTIKDAYKGIQVLKDENLMNSFKGKDVLVIGGGNVAIDVARSLKQKDVNVTICYRRNFLNSPASNEEILKLYEEKINIKELISPRLVEKGDRLNVHFDKMELFSDGSSRLNFRKTENEEILTCDFLIEATGSLVDNTYLIEALGPSFFNKNDCILDEFQKLNKRIYVIGDAAIGPKDFSRACFTGKLASLSIVLDDVESFIQNKRLAFGGSFNPPTIAHLEMIKKVLQFNPSEVLIIPNGDNYQTSFNDKTLNSFKKRVEMCNLLVKNLKSDKIKVLETENEESFKGTSFTLEKLNHPIFMMGDDCLFTLNLWKNYESLVKNNRFLIFAREKTVSEIKEKILNDPFLFMYFDHFRVIPFNYQDISSTKFKTKKDFDLLTKEVKEYIEENKMYEVK